MHLKVLESSFAEPIVDDPFSMFVARITVIVDGEHFVATSTLSREVARCVPIDAIFAPLRRQVMGAIEQRLFGDFTRREY